MNCRGFQDPQLHEAQYGRPVSRPSQFRYLLIEPARKSGENYRSHIHRRVIWAATNGSTTFTSSFCRSLNRDGGFDWASGGTNQSWIPNRQVPDSRPDSGSAHDLAHHHYSQHSGRSSANNQCRDSRFGSSLEQTQPKPHSYNRTASTPREGPWRPIEQVIPTSHNPLRTFQVDVSIPCSPFFRRLTYS